MDVMVQRDSDALSSLHYAGSVLLHHYKMMQKTHFRVFRESSPMNTNITGFRWFSKIFESLDESSLSIGRVKIDLYN